MKQGIKLLVIALVCISAFVCIYALYTALAEENAPGQFAEITGSASLETDLPAQTSSAGQEGPQESEEVDYSAPDFTVVDADGKEVKLSDFFGKPIVLNFWASWCYYCKEEMPDFDAAYKNNPDITFLMVNVTDGRSETLESAQKYVEDAGYSFPVYYDTELDAASTYGASGLPMTVFIGADGNLVTYATGMLSADNLALGISMITEKDS